MRRSFPSALCRAQSGCLANNWSHAEGIRRAPATVLADSTVPVRRGLFQRWQHRVLHNTSASESERDFAGYFFRVSCQNEQSVPPRAHLFSFPLSLHSAEACFHSGPRDRIASRMSHLRVPGQQQVSRSAGGAVTVSCRGGPCGLSHTALLLQRDCRDENHTFCDCSRKFLEEHFSSHISFTPNYELEVLA